MLSLFLSQLTTLESMYWVCAVVGGVVLVLRTIMMFMGGDVGDSDTDVDIDGGDGLDGDDTDNGFKILSLQAISSFLTMFGLVGLAMIKQSELEPKWSLLGAVAGGCAMVWLMKQVFIKAMLLQSSGNLNLDNAVGAEGTVYLTIPSGGTGKVRVAFQNRLKVLEARSQSGDELKTGEEIKVVEIHSGNVLIVNKRSS